MTEFWLHIEGFFDILFTPNVLWEIAAVALSVGLAWFVGIALRNRYLRLGIKTPTALTRSYFASYGMVVLSPAVLALGLVILARGLLFAAHYDVTVMDAA
jgi:hypothetical protein